MAGNAPLETSAAELMKANAEHNKELEVFDAEADVDQPSTSANHQTFPDQSTVSVVDQQQLAATDEQTTGVKKRRSHQQQQPRASTRAEKQKRSASQRREAACCDRSLSRQPSAKRKGSMGRVYDAQEVFVRMDPLRQVSR